MYNLNNDACPSEHYPVTRKTIIILFGDVIGIGRVLGLSTKLNVESYNKIPSMWNNVHQKIALLRIESLPR